MKKDVVYILQDLKTDIFYFKNVEIWSVFETKFNMNYTEIQSFFSLGPISLISEIGLKTEKLTYINVLCRN